MFHISLLILVHLIVIYITQNQDGKELFNAISSFFRTFGIGNLLRKCNAQKEKGVPVIDIFKYFNKTIPKYADNRNFYPDRYEKGARDAVKCILSHYNKNRLFENYCEPYVKHTKEECKLLNLSEYESITAQKSKSASLISCESSSFVIKDEPLIMGED